MDRSLEVGVGLYLAFVFLLALVVAVAGASRRLGWVSCRLRRGAPSPDSRPMPAEEGRSQGAQRRPPQGVDGGSTGGHES
jgi:hypothetical protein